MPKTTPKNQRLAQPDNAILDATGAAQLLGVSTRLVKRLAHEGKLPGKKVGREWRFRRATILRWLGEPAEPELPEDLEGLLKSGRVKIRKR